MKTVATKRLRRRAPGRGFTLIEVSLALIVFLMMTLMFAAVFPTALRAAKFSNNYSQAAQIAQHKIDQMRAAGVSNLTAAGLQNQGITDSTANPPSGLPFTASFTSVDAIANDGNNNHGYFPVGSTGTITVQDYHAINAAIPAGQMDYATVLLNWTNGSAAASRYQVSAIIIKMKHS